MAAGTAPHSDTADLRLIGEEADGSGLLLVLAADAAQLIDLAAGSVQRLPLALRGHTLMLLPAEPPHGEQRALDELRRRECLEAAHRMGAERLRDAQLQDLHLLPDALARRARHALADNGRALQAAEALRLGGIGLLGRLLDASHSSLRDDYEASTPAAEEAVRILKRAGALGARLDGPQGAVVGLFAPGALAP
ncbi:MAG: hypothetical protein ACRDKL_00620, partial [Solirubrobacteraceae bacterium]